MTEIFNIETPEWFETWFDSPEYHLLYQNRDIEEARNCINNMMKQLNLNMGSSIIDLACGRGRHALQLAELGYKVYGLDFSNNNIEYANQHLSHPDLKYYVHDMRIPFPVGVVDMVINLFTSFGYFKDSFENETVLFNIHNSLKEGGVFILDYLNTHQVAMKLVIEEKKHIEGRDFIIKRKIKDEFILKSVEVNYQGQQKHFIEKVENFSKKALCSLIENAGFEMVGIFGDYNFSPYEEKNSPRMIFKARK
jgi:SAM-dependent methyltransferase